MFFKKKSKNTGGTFSRNHEKLMECVEKARDNNLDSFIFTSDHIFTEKERAMYENKYRLGLQLQMKANDSYVYRVWIC